MRLIDADALRERMYHDAFETDSLLQKWDSGCWIRYKMFENAIEDMPTIKAEPVRRGLWIYKDDDAFAGEYACSNCNGRAEVDLYGQWILSKFCSKCGARMEKQE